MDIKQIIETNPNGLVHVIKSALGTKYYSLKQDEDKEQTFWLGVVKAISSIDYDRDPLEYLILSGWNEIRNYNKHTWSRDIVRFCSRCNKYYGYRTKICPTCGDDMQNLKRSQIYNDNCHFSHESDIDIMLNIEEFVNTLSGKQKYVAHRWLLDRADLMYQNYSKQLAQELGVSAPMISKYVKQIRTKFKRWNK